MFTPRAIAAFALTLRNPNYGAYTVGNATSLIGTWMQRVAVGWLAWELTRSGAWLGVLALSDAVFAILVGLIAGAAADRWDRLRIVKAGQWASLLQSATLCVLTATDLITMPLLLALTAFLGIVTAFVQPARHALLPSLVPTSDLPVAVVINSIAFNGARFVGPAIAGVLIATLGVESVFVANAATFGVFLAALAWIRVPRDFDPPAQRRAFASDLIEGIRYTATHAAVGPLLSVLIVTSVAGRALAELLPAFADVVFRSGPMVLAALTSSMGAGAVLAALMIAGTRAADGLMRIALTGAAAFGLAIIAFAATDQLWIGMPALVVAGGCSTLLGVSIQTLILFAVPTELRGRAMSIYGLIVHGGPAIGALLIGAWADAHGFRIPLFGAALAILCGWLWGFSQRRRIGLALADSASAHLQGGSPIVSGGGKSA